MTSLIDVIFLLLLFFMLSSTFSRFGEIPLSVGGAGLTASTEKMMFLKVGVSETRLNGEVIPLEKLAEKLSAQDTSLNGENGTPLIVSTAKGASSQRLVDVLAQLRLVQDVTVTVIN